MTTTPRIDLARLAGREGLYYRPGARYEGGKLIPTQTLPWYLDAPYFEEIARQAGLRDGQAALDVNTGNPISGVTAMYLKRSCPNARVVATDRSRQILDGAAESARMVGIDGIEWVVGYEEDLEFADATFDVVVDRLGFHHNFHPERALSEIHRVLRTGGRFILADIVMPDDFEAQNWMNATYKVKGPNHVKWYNRREIDDFLTRAGFRATTWTPWTLTMRMAELGWSSRELRDRVQKIFEDAPTRYRALFRIQGRGDDQVWTVDMFIATFVKPA